MKSFEVVVEQKNLKTGEILYQAVVETEKGTQVKLMFSEDNVIAYEQTIIPRKDLEAVLAEAQRYLDFVKVQNAK